MRAFTIWQPWASLVMIGAKPHEFRSNTYLDPRSYREHPEPGERIAVHAAARPVRWSETIDLLRRVERGDTHTGLVHELARPLLERLYNAPKKQQLLPLGCVLGTAVIGKPVLACDLFKLKVADSDRGDFNWAWPLCDLLPLEPPVPVRGQQGFWHWQAQEAA